MVQYSVTIDVDNVDMSLGNNETATISEKKEYSQKKNELDYWYFWTGRN